MDLNYWEKYYDKHNKPFEPSDFAKYVLKYINRYDYMIDMGCGNGRDSLFFAKYDIHVIAMDQCENIINTLNEYNMGTLHPICGDFTNISLDINLDHAYSRFTLHSINEEDEDKTLHWMKTHIKKYVFIEVRSDMDNLINKNTDHYRRFMNFENMIIKLINLKFKIKYAEISNGFSKYNSVYDVNVNEDDPMLIRIICDNS